MLEKLFGGAQGGYGTGLDETPLILMSLIFFF